MAVSKKKTAKKRKTTRKTTPRKGTVTVLPKGFTAIESGFGRSWPDEDTKIGEAITGIVTGYRDVPRAKNKGGDTQVMTVEIADGTSLSLWKGAVLTPLFEEDYEGMEVWIRYDGLAKKKRGQNPARLYTYAYKE